MRAPIQRYWWQIVGMLVLNTPFIGPNLYAWLTVPALNCYACPLAQGACPIGTIQHFLVIGMIPFLALGVIGAFGVVAGRFYCSHICPFGFFQDLLGKLTKKKHRLPRWAGYGKYASLVILALIIPPLVNEPFFCTLCPAGSLEAGIPIVAGAYFEVKRAGADIFSNAAGIIGMVGWWFWFKMSILVGMIALTLTVRRPFCRMVCPMGALLGLFNRISFFVHPPAEKAATGHGYYLKECPVQINHPDDVDSHNCIKCKQCYHRPGE
jgi:polyferredoxin